MFPSFFARVLALRLPEAQSRLAQHEQTAYLLFMIHAFQSLEDDMVRSQVRHLQLYWTPAPSGGRGGGKSVVSGSLLYVRILRLEVIMGGKALRGSWDCVHCIKV